MKKSTLRPVFSLINSTISFVSEPVAALSVNAHFTVTPSNGLSLLGFWVDSVPSVVLLSGFSLVLSDFPHQAVLKTIIAARLKATLRFNALFNFIFVTLLLFIILL